MWSSAVLWKLLPERLGIAGRDVPVDPTAEEARRWAREELARGAYNQEPSVWERFWRWVVETLGNLVTGASTTSSWVMPTVLVVALAVLLVLVFRLGGSVRRTQRGARPSPRLFADERAARDLRADSERAERAGDLATAFLERFRAIIRTLDERDLLDDTPGMTAHEAGVLARAALPALAPECAWAADTFDAVHYGDRLPGMADMRRLRALDEAAARAGRALPQPAAPA